MLGCGVVLSEATCVAVEGSLNEDGEEVIKAFGDKARALSGKAAHNTRIVNPVCEGEIVYPNLLTALLRYFLEKVEVTPRKARTTEVLFIVPCSATPELRNQYMEVAKECNIGRVYFTLTPYAAVMGHDVMVTQTTPVFCVDVGYGKTDVAAFSLDGIISGSPTKEVAGLIKQFINAIFTGNSEFLRDTFHNSFSEAFTEFKELIHDST